MTTMNEQSIETGSSGSVFLGAEASRANNYFKVRLRKVLAKPALPPAPSLADKTQYAAALAAYAEQRISPLCVSFPFDDQSTESIERALADAHDAAECAHGARVSCWNLTSRVCFIVANHRRNGGRQVFEIFSSERADG